MEKQIESFHQMSKERERNTRNDYEQVIDDTEMSENDEDTDTDETETVKIEKRKALMPKRIYAHGSHYPQLNGISLILF